MCNNMLFNKALALPFSDVFSLIKPPLWPLCLTSACGLVWWTDADTLTQHIFLLTSTSHFGWEKVVLKQSLGDLIHVHALASNPALSSIRSRRNPRYVPCACHFVLYHPLAVSFRIAACGFTPSRYSVPSIYNLQLYSLNMCIHWIQASWVEQPA